MLYIGNTPAHNTPVSVQGQYIDLEGERFYRIDHYDQMHPFFISLASDADLWMYLSSTGGLTAGRQNPEKALFPYYTDDKVTLSSDHTGPKTILKVTREGRTYLWEPFSSRYAGVYEIERSLSKNTIGNKLLFEEVNHTLGLTFSYLWCSAAAYGWIRKVRLTSQTTTPTTIELLDGLLNVLPAGVERITQNTFSTLVDAYKRTERVENTALVLFRMEAIMMDRAEPSEALTCNSIYTLGLPFEHYLLSDSQLDAFRAGESIVPEPITKGVPGAILAHFQGVLPALSSWVWYFVCDVEASASKVCQIQHALQQPEVLIEHLEQAVKDSCEHLKSIVAKNDGIEQTADQANDVRHFANTLFNTMRGGYYIHAYQLNGKAFQQHIEQRNRPLASRYATFLSTLPESLSYLDLLQLVLDQHDAQLLRLFYEYLPLTFGRRHGDPSRPWNLFDVQVQDEQGNPLISYQGNWRDIFQNWEALSLSYPGFVNSIIAKFLNATTVEGYNPYKMTHKGIDWEVIEKENPWSNIGYWGDHQIIYLLRLLELSYQHDPDALLELLSQRCFSFANVPYRLKKYADIVLDPKNTICFDEALHQSILALEPSYGSDARLVMENHQQPLLTTGIDKLLITLLAKLSNLVPDAGIWMNTLRPEWNDANNALVGQGASMVTLCYMRRYVRFVEHLLAGEDDRITLSQEPLFTLSQEVKQWGSKVKSILEHFLPYCEQGFDASARRLFVDQMGLCAEQYRTQVYAGFSGEQASLSTPEVVAFLRLVARYLDASIAHAKRADGLWEAYNLIHFTESGIEIDHLPCMLEGQVAVLSALVLSGEQVADLLDHLRASSLYRPDQQSYMLYPNRQLPNFVDKNTLSKEMANTELIQRLLKRYPHQIVEQDEDGFVHFRSDFHNATYLQQALLRLPEPLCEQDQTAVLALYEQLFHHHAFTGRSGTFYKYEGLGSIYWHMVSKLLVAVAENIAHTRALAPKNSVLTPAQYAVLQRLQNHYWDIRAGIGAHKSPAVYGAFPFDPYSHTPAMLGAQQPGMTGQVKEDLLTRFFELGVLVEQGTIRLNPSLLRPSDFEEGQLRFTYCATPFVYRLAPESGAEKGNTTALATPFLTLEKADGTTLTLPSCTLPEAVSQAIFWRTGEIKCVTLNQIVL